jgi:hypothetical protein
MWSARHWLTARLIAPPDANSPANTRRARSALGVAGESQGGDLALVQPVDLSGKRRRECLESQALLEANDTILHHEGLEPSDAEHGDHAYLDDGWQTLVDGLGARKRWIPVTTRFAVKMGNAMK